MNSRETANQDSSASRLPAFIFFFFLSLYALTGQGSIQTSDGKIMFFLAQSMVERHSLSIGSNLSFVQSSSVFNEPGKQFSKFGLGMSLIAVPFYLIGKFLSFLLNIDPSFATQFCVGMVNVPVSALTCMMIFRFSRERLGFSEKTSTVLSLAYGLSTMAWAYSEDFMSEPATSLCVLCGVYFITDGDPRRGSKGAIWAGACMGMALLIRLATVVAVPAFVVYIFLLWRDSGRQEPRELVADLTRFGVPQLLFLSVILAYNHVRFGGIFETGYANEFLGFFFVGFLGFLFSPGKSVFLYDPIVLVGLLESARFFKLRFKMALLFFLIVAANVFLYSNWYSWFGGLCWGPRFLLPILPYLLFPAGYILEGSSKAAKRAVVWAIVAGAAIQIPSITVNIGRYDVHVRADIEDAVEANYRLLYSWRESALVGQAKEMVAVLENLGDKERMEKIVSQALSRRDFSNATYREILENGLALNAPNFWWFYMYLFGFPFYLSVLPPITLSSSVLFLGYKIYRFQKAPAAL